MKNREQATTCVLVGDETLTIHCAELLLHQGYQLRLLVTRSQPVREWATRQVPTLPVLPPDDLADELETASAETYAAYQVDYLFAIGHSTPLSAEVLALAGSAAIGYHNGPLPRYAGEQATAWAVLNGEQHHGVSWYLLRPGSGASAYTGDLLKQMGLTLAPDETTFRLNLKCHEAALHSFAELLADLAGDHLAPTPQDLHRQTYYAPGQRPPAMALVRWNQSAEQISALVRALHYGSQPNPLGLPKVSIHGHMFGIATVQPATTRSSAIPGTVVRLERDSIQLATASHDLHITLQTLAGQPLSTAEVARRTGLQPGSVLDDPSPALLTHLGSLDARLAPHEPFWAARLAHPQPLELPYLLPEPASTAASAEPAADQPRHRTQPVVLPGGLSAFLHLQSTGANSPEAQTIAGVVQAMFAAYLARLSGNAHFDLGFESLDVRRLQRSDPQHPDPQQRTTAALVAALVPLRVAIDETQPFSSIFAAIQHALRETRQHLTYLHDLPARYPAVRAASRPDMRVCIVQAEQSSAYILPPGVALALVVAGNTVSWCYDSHLLPLAQSKRMLRQFEAFMYCLVANPSQSMAALSLLTEDERQHVLVDYNATARTFAAYPAGHCLHHLITAQAARRPEAIALRCGNQQLSYRALETWASHLCQQLRGLGVGPETLVGLYVSRSPALIAGVLGILKTGAAYVPLEPDYPPERLRLILDDASVAALVTETALHDRLPLPDVPLLLADALPGHPPDHDTARTPADMSPENLAYVIYTSGSTGTPKGVQVPHQAVINLMYAMRDQPGFSEDDRLLAVTTLAFDLAVPDVFLPLTTGGCMVLAGRDTAQDGQALAAALHRYSITCMQATPATWRLLVESGWQGKPDLKIICGGEALPWELAQQLLARGQELWNMYGPTETTVWSAAARVHPTDGAALIGPPLPNTRFYVVDQYGHPVPPGVPGELWIGGAGMARGYANRPDLTAAAFVPDTFTPASAPPGTRLYRTGDSVRYRIDRADRTDRTDRADRTDRTDQRLEFLNRIDYQVKIRGYRIEPGEIETVLRQHPAIREAVVLAHQDSPDEAHNSRLVAYVVPHSDSSTAERPDQAEQPALPDDDEQVQQWGSIYDHYYAQEATTDDPTFNTSGWLSSYTGQPVPPEEIRVWLHDTLAPVQAHQPRRVFEIGCGTGLLLFPLAPTCETYWAADPAASALDYIQQQLDNPRPHGPAIDPQQVRLLHRAADDFQGIPANFFDTIIINSVIQYFPTVAYLLEVIERSLDALAPGGLLLIGDIRSLPLLEAFHTSVQVFQAADSLPTAQLRQQVQAALLNEEQFMLDPRFFAALQQHEARICHAAMHLKRSPYANEQTKFRYNMLLSKCPDPVHPADNAPAAPAVSWQPWQADQRPEDLLATVRQQLAQQPPAYGISGLPNARLVTERAAMQMLHPAAETVLATTGDLRQAIDTLRAEYAAASFEPETFWQLGADYGYQVEIGWSLAGPDAQPNANANAIPGRFDVLFVRETDSPTRPRLPVLDPTRLDPARPWHSYANNPQQAVLAHNLPTLLREHLATRLPDYMLPTAFVLLDSFPLTPNGKIDRKALPAPASTRPAATRQYSAPRTPVETQVARIWADVLGLEQVGLEDDFFSLGGHSLRAIQIVARLRTAFQVDLPLRSMFEGATVARLAETIETLRWLSHQQPGTPLAASQNTEEGEI